MNRALNCTKDMAEKHLGKKRFTLSATWFLVQLEVSIYNAKFLKNFNFFTDSLAEELISCGIMTNYKKIASGIWNGDIETKRLFNFDETPQFINYGVDGTQSGRVYAPVGESCKKMTRENRENVTICPIVSLEGKHVALFFFK